MVVILLQPPCVYVIVTVPPDTPPTTPVLRPTVAIAELLLLQVPPAVASLKPIVDPAQTELGPVMLATELVTVTVAVSDTLRFTQAEVVAVTE
jgi:hypothetical protein